MIKRHSLVVCVAVLCVRVSFALTETINGITWTYSVDNGVASAGGGYYSSPAVSNSTSGAIAIPSELGGYPVRSIGSYAFYGCTNLTSVAIPNSVTSIGNSAFSGCSGLTSVTIPDGVTSLGHYAFSGCICLTNVTIPNGVTRIGDWTFEGCSCLTGVTIPASITSIGTSAFYCCSGLTSVAIPASVTNIGDCALSYCKGLLAIDVSENNENYSSENNLLLSKDGKILIQGVNGNVVIPASVTSIANYAFYGCSDLTSVMFPDSVTNIGDLAFADCSLLTNVTIPDSVTSIGDWAFEGCRALTNVTNSGNVMNIGAYAFARCGGLADGTTGQSVGTSLISLDFSRNQPFRPGTIKGGNNNMEYTQIAENRVFWQTMLDNGRVFCELEQCTLFDYLDRDDVPLSLAMPCAERVPMLTALAPVGNVSVEFTSLTPVGQPMDDIAKMERREVFESNIKITFSGMALKSTLIYPFTDGKPPEGCTAQAFARLVFIGAQAAGGAAAASVSLRNNGFARNFRPLNDAEWTATVADNDQFQLVTGSSQGNLAHTPAQDCLLVTLAGQDVSWTPPVNIQNLQNCWTNKLLQLQSATTLQKPIIRQVVVSELVSTPAGEYTKGAVKNTYYQILLNPFGADGNVLDVRSLCTAAGPDGMSATDFATLSTQYALTPYLVTWVRVKQNGKTVDMVPATYEDDKAFNGIDNRFVADIPFIGIPLGIDNVYHSMPIMRFPGTLSFTYADVNSGTTLPQNQWTVKSCYAVDPRFNWAPENWWFDANDANPTGQKWYDAVFNDGGILDQLVTDELGSGYGRADRANDPFLFVSNLGFLLSVGELAFLPRLSDMTENSRPHCVLGERKETIEAGANNGSLYDGNPRDLTSVATMPCALAAWRSYQSFRTNPSDDTFEFGANLYRRGLVNGPQDFYVNPYSQDMGPMLTAFTNTPHSYWVLGGSNDPQNLMGIQEGDITNIVIFLRRRFEDLASMIEAPQSMDETDLYVYQKLWEDMFDALDWGGAVGCTVEDVYDTLAQYYDLSDANNRNYREMYTLGINSYSDLNHFARGGGKRVISTNIRLRKELAVHKEDFNLKADPLRGQHADDIGDTSCWNSLHDVDRKFLYSYWRDHFAPRLTPDAPVFSPTSGTTFDSYLSVSISCPTEGATIHYTTNGMEPTAESPVYRRFRIYGKTTVKAVAELNGVLGDVAVAEYAMGRCADPVVTPADGTEFGRSNQEVSIAWDAADGVLRYTLDGSDPTTESPAYEGPFTIGESAVVKAKVFGENYFDSVVVTASLVRVWTTVETPVIAAAATFTGSKTKVSISCATEGATVRYTLDGSDPDSRATRYAGPFYVAESCTVKAYATKADCLPSAVATQLVEKVWGVGDTMGDPDQAFTTDGSGGLGWTRVADATAPNGEAMKSGAVTHNQWSSLSTTVTGAGTLAFAWRTSCEEDPDGYYEWDHAEFVVDGTVVRSLDGVTAWTSECVEIAGDGEHAVEWRYVKDDVESAGEDAAWVAGFRWGLSATQTTDVPVPYAWLSQHAPGVADGYAAYESAAKATAANGRKVWECYVLGLDPGVATSDFRIVSFPMMVDGTPDLASLVLDPPPSRWNVPATWKVMSAAALEGPWEEVSAAVAQERDPPVRFFKVEVRLIGVPADVAASSGSSAAVDLMWSAVADATGYEVWRGTGTAIDGAERISVVSNATSYADTAAVAGTAYRYWVRSVSGDVYGAFSEPVVGMRKARDKVQLWADGPYWATANIGAESPEDYGYYFWWGDTIGYRRENDAWVATDGSSLNFSFSTVPTDDKSIATLQSEGWITSDGVLAPEHDAAHVQWGGSWRMPTMQELSDLNSNCDWTWATMNGVSGYVVRGRGDYASNSIFLPCCGYGLGTSLYYSGSYGYYWSSVPVSGSYYAYELYFYSGSHSTYDYGRYYGRSVRPVQGFTE